LYGDTHGDGHDGDDQHKHDQRVAGFRTALVPALPETPVWVPGIRKLGRLRSSQLRESLAPCLLFQIAKPHPISIGTWVRNVSNQHRGAEAFTGQSKSLKNPWHSQNPLLLQVRRIAMKLKTNNQKLKTFSMPPGSVWIPQLHTKN